MSQGRSSYALIVDDHPLSLQGMQRFLEELRVVGRVITVAGLAAIDKLLAEHGRPRLAMIDFWLADGPATPTIRHLQLATPSTRLVVVSSDDRPVIQSRARALGVHGFVSKRDPPRDYRNAVLAVLAGRTWFGGDTLVAAAAAAVVGAPSRPPAYPSPAPGPGVDDGSADLTLRQREVLDLVLQGRPNNLIEQFLSPGPRPGMSSNG